MKNITFRKLYFWVYSLTAVILIFFGLTESKTIIVFSNYDSHYGVFLFSILLPIAFFYIITGSIYLFFLKKNRLNNLLIGLHYLFTTINLGYILRYFIHSSSLASARNGGANIIEVKYFLIVLGFTQFLLLYGILSTIAQNKNHQLITDLLDDDFE